jgi:hypothetical protein
MINAAAPECIQIVVAWCGSSMTMSGYVADTRSMRRAVSPLETLLENPFSAVALLKAVQEKLMK